MLHGERDLQRKPQLMISGNYPACGALTPGGDRPSGPTGTYVRGVDPQKGLANQC